MPYIVHRPFVHMMRSCVTYTTWRPDISKHVCGILRVYRLFKDYPYINWVGDLGLLSSYMYTMLATFQHTFSFHCPHPKMVRSVDSSSGRLRASHLYRDSDSRLAEELKQTPCPCYFTWKVGSSASPAKLFTGQV